MNWEGELLDLYEKNSFRAGVTEYREYRDKDGIRQIPYVLLPVFHATVTAQIEVILDGQGNFLDASRVDNEDKMTVIPVTEKSGSRTAGKAPHPLCDNIQYLAGDYEIYGPEQGKEDGKCFEMYMEALKQWSLWEHTHPKVCAVYEYLKKGRLISDLVHQKVLVLDEDGKLDKAVKLQNVSQEKALVRFVVRQKMAEGPEEEKCWLDSSLQNCFIRYYRFLQGRRELDYLTGKMESSSYLHSKKIRNEGDGAKLISSNDEANFTYRGRFATKEEAFCIGNETSQKIHNALKWIIRRQGHSFETLMMVTWESDMQRMPDWEADTETISSGTETNEDPFADDMAGYGEEISQSIIPDGNPWTAEQFCQALKGYRKHVDNTSRMVLLAFDAATTGRLALAEYKTLDTGRYLANIEKWHLNCGWMQEKFKNGGRKRYYGVPGVRDIANLLFGSDSKGVFGIPDKNGKRTYAEISRRLLPCIWDGRELPWDLVMRAVERASSPQIYKERYNWEKVLALACSFVKKHRYDKDKEEWDVALDKNCGDRNYLYGRLLAVADRIEYRTFDAEGDSGRVTNAKRYMTTFSQRPFETWKIIEENFQPYLNKLKVTERRYYENLLNEICDLFEVKAFADNGKLDGLYLLGFHSESLELKKYKSEEN